MITAELIQIRLYLKSLKFLGATIMVILSFTANFGWTTLLGFLTKGIIPNSMQFLGAGLQILGVLH